jgi:hypothetical protein
VQRRKLWNEPEQSTSRDQHDRIRHAQLTRCPGECNRAQNRERRKALAEPLVVIEL